MDTDVKMLEARLNAHREILISLLSERLISPESAPELLRSLEQEVLMRDGSEDPGVEPSAGLGRGQETSEAIRDILDTATARAAALRRNARDLHAPNGFTEAEMRRT